MKVYWFALATAVLWGLAPLFDKIGLGKATPLAALSVRTIVIALGLGIFMAASGGWREMRALDTRTITFLVLGGLAAGLIGQLTYYYALKIDDASRVVPLIATYPLVAVVLTIVFLKEPITPGKVVGALFIVLGVLAIRLDSVLWRR